MKEGLLKIIQESGYWRINIRPVVVPSEKLSFGECREIVQKSAVSLRGWDFPHISRKGDDTGGSTNGDVFVENWTNWWGFNEFWRMYQSTQFLAYIALREDTKPEEDFGNLNFSVLSTVGTVYQITEVMEFCNRLQVNGLYRDGLDLKITLKNTANRRLHAGKFSIPFFDVKITRASEIELQRTVEGTQLAEDYRSIAVDVCLELFDRFGWNPDKSQLKAQQESLYRRDAAY
jgi:hypothetical protein